jgi:hypothetical protein
MKNYPILLLCSNSIPYFIIYIFLKGCDKPLQLRFILEKQKIKYFLIIKKYQCPNMAQSTASSIKKFISIPYKIKR